MARVVRNFVLGLLPWLVALPTAVRAQEAPTDEVLKELERQIEQKEIEQAEAKDRAEAEAKKKAESDRKNKEEEVAKQAAEEEHQRMEEAKRKEEQEKWEKYSRLIVEAEQAIRNRDKETAIAKFSEALTLYPDEAAPKAGIAGAEKMPDKVCLDFPGVWEWEGGGTITVNSDGTLRFGGPFSVSGTWECTDPKIRMFVLRSIWGEQTAVLRSDGCLRGKGGGGREGCYWKKISNSVKSDDRK